LGTEFQNFSLAPSLSLRLGGFSFFSFFVVVVACWCCCLLVTIRADGVLSRIADDEMLKIVLLRIKKQYTGDAKDGHDDGRKAANEKSVDAFEEIHPFFGWEVAHPEYE
jgi:hypothetical protein